MRAAKGEGSGFRAKSGPNMGMYRAYVTIDGKRKYTPWVTNKAELGQMKRELLNRRDAGTLIAGRVPTVEQWMNHWLDSVAKHRPTTYAMDRWVTDKRIIPELGTIRLDKLTTERLEQWVTWLNVAPTSARRYLAPLKTALSVAAARGHVARNVAESVELEKQKRTKKSAFSREDRDAILAAATGRNRARWHLGLKLGLRPAEVLGLTWPDFDPDAGTLTISHQLLYAKGAGMYLQPAAKTDAGERTIKLPKTLATMLREHRTEQLLLMAQVGDDWKGWDFDGEPVALMFPQENGRPTGAGTDIRLWKALLAAAGLGSVKRYKGRHTAASHMIVDSGGDIAVTAKVLGHADPGFTYRTYVSPLEEREQQMADRLDGPAAAPYVAPYAPGASEHERIDEGEKARK
jgi:integrase